jgi:hypothetical protein
MAHYARFAGAALALALTGFSPQQQLVPGLLSCHGDFGQFANKFIIARPMELNFIVDWALPSVFTDGGRGGRIVAFDAYNLVFEVQYEGYRVTYHVNRIDGSISQRPNFGGAYFGTCELRPLERKF